MDAHFIYKSTHPCTIINTFGVENTHYQLEKYVDKKRKVTLAFRPEDITCDDNGELTVLVDQCDQYGENFVSIVCSQEAEEPTYLSVCKQLEVQSVVKLAIDKKHLLCYDTESEMLLF